MLLLSKHPLERWRELACTTHKQRYARLLEQAGSYTELPPSEQPSDSVTYIGMAVANLGLAYCLSQDPRYLANVRRWFAVAIAYPHWGKERMPDNDLDAAWLLCGLGLGYDWLKAELPEKEREALRNKLLLQGQRLYDFACGTEGQWWSSAYWQNHNWICYCGLATAAYALEAEHPETRTWAERAFANFQTALPIMPDDGSDYEGPVYWRYGFIWFLLYADLVQQQSGTDLHDNDFLKNAFAFRLYLSAPDLISTANFGDCHDRRSAHSAATYYRLASLYHSGQAQWLCKHFEATGEWAREGREGLVKPGVLPEAWLEFLWYDPSINPAPLEDLPLVRAFPDLGLVSMRSSWHEDATVMVFKCGTPSGHKAWAFGHHLNRERNWQTLNPGHAHPDENSFVLMRGKDYLVVDEGYSGAKFSKHHSTVLVDGQGQYREGPYNAFKEVGPLWGGRLEDMWTSGEVTYIRGEAARAYAPELGLERFARELLFCGDLVVMQDTLAAQGERTFDWLLQSDVPPQRVSPTSFVVVAGDTPMHVHILEPHLLAWRCLEEEISANPTSAKPDWIIRRTQYALALKQGAASARFTVALSLGGLEAAPLACTRGLVLEATRGSERWCSGFSQGASGIEGQGIETDASYLALREKDKKLEHLLLGDATQLWLEGNLKLVSDAPISVAMQREGSSTTWRVRALRGAWLRLATGPTAQVRVDGALRENAFSPDLPFFNLHLPGGETEIEVL